MSPARLIPDTTLEEITIHSEQVVARALVEGLDERWIIIHSYPWLRPSRSDADYYLKEGETDFVLLHPEHGMLVLEVKGAEVTYRPDNGTWYQDSSRGRNVMKDPFKQVSRNMHELVGQIKQRTDLAVNGELTFPYGYAVIFPDCDYAGPTPPGASPEILFGARDLDHMGKRVVQALKRYARPGVDAVSPAAFKKVRDALLPAFQLTPVLSRRIAQDEPLLVRLTEQQRMVVAALQANPRVRVEGPAGSGKTMLATDQACRFAREGKKTLFLCYNKALATYLQMNIQEPGLTIRHFHGLCRDLCKEAGVPFKVPLEPQSAAPFWREVAWDLLSRAREQLGRTFDAIVVDEAQDFHSDWWLSIEELGGGDNASLYIFFDRLQNVFDAALGFPKTGTLFSLPANCRNTKRIARAVGRTIERDIPTWEFSPEGADVSVRRYTTQQECQKVYHEEMQRLLGPGRLKPQQIAILSPHRANPDLLGGSRYHITQDLSEWRAGQGIYLSTVRTFKGLEADVVILLDTSGIQGGKLETHDLYVATSRAKHYLLLITANDATAQILAPQSTGA